MWDLGSCTALSIPAEDKALLLPLFGWAPHKVTVTCGDLGAVDLQGSVVGGKDPSNAQGWG